jgi:phage shock protein C
MFCTKCGFQLRDADRYCSGCGSRTAAEAPPQVHRALRLDKCNRKIAGVCAGFARYFDVDVVLVRVLILMAALCTGVGFLAYLAAWIVIPADCGSVAQPAPHTPEGLSFSNT